MALARAQMALSLDLNRARYELEQRKKARTKSLDRHAKLLDDRGLMEIKSPADGIVFYGQCVNGRWSDTPSLINKYKPQEQRLARLDADDDRRTAARCTSRPRSTKASGPTSPTARRPRSPCRPRAPTASPAK